MTDGKVTDNGGDVHTPQIWEWTRQDGEFTALVWRHPEGGGGYILEPEISDDAESAGEIGIFVSEGHARLIAAAPDLLYALQNLLAVHEGEGGTRYHAGDIARAAIAKATGR